MRKPVGICSSPLLIGVIAVLIGCGDGTLVGVSPSPPPPEMRPAGSPVPPVATIRVGCSSLPNLSDIQIPGPQDGTLPAGVGRPGAEAGLPDQGRVVGAARPDAVSRVPSRTEVSRFKNAASLATSYQNCSLQLRRRSNYAVAW